MISSYLYPVIISLLLSLSICQSQTSTTSQSNQSKTVEQFDMKSEVYKRQLQTRDALDVSYGTNTELLTFAVSHMVDFVVKPLENQVVKIAASVYWKENNVYVGPEYREGENLRVLIYEDNYRILSDNKFYIMQGVKFQAEKGKVYTIRFLDEGRISKLVTMQMNKFIGVIEDKASKQHIDTFSRRMNNVADEVKILGGISEFTIVMHEKGAKAMNHGFCIYMTYLIVQACIIIVIVALQVRVFMKMLKNESVV